MAAVAILPLSLDIIHMRLLQIRRFLELCIIIILVLPFSIATSPVLPPYHQYVIHGTLERPAGGSRENFAVTLLGNYQSQTDTGFHALPRVAHPESGEMPVALTDATGAFYLVVNSAVEADSLRLAIVIADRSPILGVPFSKETFESLAHSETYQTDTKPGCLGCATDPDTQERVVYYSHSISQKTITVPF